MGNRCLAVLGGTLVICLAASSPVAGVQPHPFVLTQSPHVETSAAGFGFRANPPDGSRIILVKSKSRDDFVVLTNGFAAACDPCLSFDARRILFAGKRTPDDNWNIWEVNLPDVEPGEARQITSNLGDCREPEYLAPSSITPPEFDDKVDWVVFTSTAAGTYDDAGGEVATALYVQNLAPIEGRGIVTWRTTFNVSHDFSPTVLGDGRVLFSSWQQQGGRRPPHGMIALMTTNWAGTGLNAFYGNHQGATVKSMACEMPDRTVVFVESDGSTRDGSGRLARVSFSRPLKSHKTLSDGKGRYKTPQAWPGWGLAVSYDPGDGDFGAYLFDYERHTVRRALYDDPDWDDWDAILIAPRDEPMGRITIVVDSKETGHMQCLNVYDSDRPEAEKIARGDVKGVRFVEGIPARDASPAATRILGEAPVEPDGSFYVEVPADTPFFIETLDGQGNVLQKMNSWMWVRRGGRRGCIGCHENKELAPENRATQALIKAMPHRLVREK